MKNITYIIFFSIFLNFILSYDGILYLTNNCSAIFNININDVEEAISLYYEKDNFISGSIIKVSLNISSCSDKSCLNIYGFINYTDFNDLDRNTNTYLLFKYNQCYAYYSSYYPISCTYDYSYKKNKNVYGIYCYFYCINVNCNMLTSRDYVILTAYLPFRCEDDVNKTYYLNIGDKINITEKIKIYFNSPTTDYIIKFNLIFPPLKNQCLESKNPVFTVLSSTKKILSEIIELNVLFFNGIKLSFNI
jgi:hypothetical protein